jgi:membrane-bound lytic murein transglycosylase A
MQNVFSKEAQIRLNNGVILKRSSFSNLYKWEEENYKEALDVFLKSCERIMSLSLSNPIFPQLNGKINKNDFYTVCKIGSVIKNYNREYIQVFFENYFIPFEVKNESNFSLFTGYYIPTINAKRKKDKIFKYPIYRKPDDLVSGTKYYTREEINNGILDDRNLEILYTDDFIELFFLHIQGSGNVYLADEKKMLSIGFDGKNNHKYSSIGKYMAKNNLINGNDSSSRGIKNELKKDVKLAEQILNVNKSYIFFKILDNNKIKGAFDMELIPFRTIAVDKKIIPFGFPLWLNTTHNKKDKKNEFNKIVIANDTGSAIEGVIRGDIFFGFGEEGENNATFQYSTGKYYLLIPTKIAKKYEK